jgi:hypothetical protein
MVLYKKTNIAVKRHEGELADAVVVDNAGDFVGKCPEAEDVGNGTVVDVVDEIVVGVDVGDVIILDGFNEVGHDGDRDGDGDTDARSFRGDALNAFPGLFHVAF